MSDTRSDASLESETTPSRASVPPPEPRTVSRGSLGAVDLESDKTARFQMLVALGLGLVLIAVPLYLWRRPRAEALTVATAASAGDGMGSDAPPPPPEVVRLTDVKVLACLDPGPKKTPPERCDHLSAVEQALGKAIEETASCVPKEAAGGTIVFVADVSFKKRSIGVLVPKEGRTIKSTAVALGCQGAVKAKLQSVALDGVAHEHARYKLAVTATYLPK